MSNKHYKLWEARIDSFSDGIDYTSSENKRQKYEEEANENFNDKQYLNAFSNTILSLYARKKRDDTSKRWDKTSVANNKAKQEYIKAKMIYKQQKKITKRNEKVTSFKW